MDVDTSRIDDDSSSSNSVAEDTKSQCAQSFGGGGKIPEKSEVPQGGADLSVDQIVAYLNCKACSLSDEDTTRLVCAAFHDKRDRMGTK